MHLRRNDHCERRELTSFGRDLKNYTCSPNPLKEKKRNLGCRDTPESCRLTPSVTQFVSATLEIWVGYSKPDTRKCTYSQVYSAAGILGKAFFFIF